MNEVIGMHVDSMLLTVKFVDAEQNCGNLPRTVEKYLILIVHKKFYFQSIKII